MHYKFKKMIVLSCLILLINPLHSISQIDSEDSNFSTLTAMSEGEWNSLIPEEVHTLYQNGMRADPPFRTNQFFTVDLINTNLSPLLILEFLPQMESLSLYYYSPAAHRWVEEISGDMVAMNDRSLPYISVIIPVETAAREALPLYLCVRDYQEKHLKMRVVTAQTFLLNTGRHNAFYYFAYSFILIIALSHLFHFFTGKKSFFLYYALIMICLVVTRMGKNRDLSYLFLRDSPYGFFVYIFFTSLMVIFSLLFLKSYFYLSWKSLEGKIMAVMALLFAVIASFSLVYPAPLLGRIINLLILPVLGFCLFLIIRESVEQNLSSRIFLLSFVPLISGAILENLFMYLETLPMYRQGAITLTGTVIHTVLMSYSLARQQSDLNRLYDDLRYSFNNKLDYRVKERTRELEKSATHDGLTGLYNRISLERTIKDLEKNANGKLGILFADLDNFKYYNDVFGHDTGDRILVKVAAHIRSQFRQQDMIFRFGGDEFLILMPDTDLEQGEKLSIRLHRAFQDLIEEVHRELDEAEGCLGISLGLACWQPGTSLRESISLADQKLLSAKAEGKNRLMVHG